MSPMSSQDTEKSSYDGIMREVTSNLTILYLHGGSFYMGSPAGSRAIVAQLVKRTGGRVFSLDYRLSPQEPFPAALLDALVAYLALLYPPDGAFHDPVPASSIVLAGDSSGANLCFALLIIILHLEANKPPSLVRFNGQDRILHKPAGVATVCGYFDLTLALPSCEKNRKFDIIGHGGLTPPFLKPDFPACSAWPSSPPRGEIYCDPSAMAHPLVSPITASTWVGAPPLLFICGEEILADSNQIIAQQAARQGACIQWEQYTAMPHIFMTILPDLPQSRLCYNKWASFCKNCVGDGGALKSQATIIEGFSLRKTDIPPENMNSLSMEQVTMLMRKRIEERKALTLPQNIKSTL
ncbi:hypothetical protein ACLMJK_006327 [Lecanora helva]